MCSPRHWSSREPSREPTNNIISEEKNMPTAFKSRIIVRNTSEQYQKSEIGVSDWSSPPSEGHGDQFVSVHEKSDDLSAKKHQKWQKIHQQTKEENLSYGPSQFDNSVLIIFFKILAMRANFGDIVTLKSNILYFWFLANLELSHNLVSPNLDRSRRQLSNDTKITKFGQILVHKIQNSYITNFVGSR